MIRHTGSLEPSGFGSAVPKKMKVESGQIRLAATDLSNHLACGHLTTLELGVARGERAAPEWRAPDLIVIQELGLWHEAAYLKSLDDGAGSLVDLREIRDEARALAETRAAMERGAAASSQGTPAGWRGVGAAGPC